MARCDENCSHLYPAPDFVRAEEVTCERYRKWLDRQAQSCRRRDPRANKPEIDEYLRRIHKAVQDCRGEDFYTGERLEWNRLNHALSLDGGRKRHKQRGHYPSVDHYTGTASLDFRICSANVNHAKGPLSHDQFLKLCQKVVSQKQRRDSKSRSCSDRSGPTAARP